jgi:hypothetical protein
MAKLQWKEYGDGPDKKRSILSLLHCHVDSIDCYISFNKDEKWHWSVYSTEKGVNASITGKNESLDAAKEHVNLIVDSLQKIFKSLKNTP